MNADHRRVGQLRQGQGDVANHVIDEFVAGRLSRLDFLRRGSVVGISLPLLGAIVSACGSSGDKSAAKAPASVKGKDTISIAIIAKSSNNPVFLAARTGAAACCTRASCAFSLFGGQWWWWRG